MKQQIKLSNIHYKTINYCSFREQDCLWKNQHEPMVKCK